MILKTLVRQNDKSFNFLSPSPIKIVLLYEYDNNSIYATTLIAYTYINDYMRIDGTFELGSTPFLFDQ